MNREKELAQNTIIISFGQIMPRLTSIITLPILTACLTKTEYGTYDLISTLVSLLLPVVILRLDLGVFRFLIEYRDDKEKQSEIVSTSYLFIASISLVCVVIMFFCLYMLSISTRLLICFYFYLDILFTASQQMVRGFSKNNIYSISAILHAVINMVFIVLLVAMQGFGLNGLLVSMNIAELISILFLFISGGLWKYIRIVFSTPLLKEMLSYSWPLIPNSLSLWVMNLSDRLIITAVMGVEMEAVYAVANKIPNLLNIVQSSFSAAWQENASLTVNSDDTCTYYSSVFDTVFCILVGATAGLIAFTPLLFAVLIQGDYEDAYFQMPFLFGGMFFAVLSSFFGGIYAAHKRSRSVGFTTILAAGCNFLINILFIRVIGLYAASISTFVSYLLLTIFRMVDIRKFQKMKYNIKKMIFWLAALCIMAFISHINNFYLNIFNLILGIVIAIVSNRNLVVMAIDKVFHRN